MIIEITAIPAMSAGTVTFLKDLIQIIEDNTLSEWTRPHNGQIIVCTKQGLTAISPENLEIIANNIQEYKEVLRQH